jgi:hypothetical protein
VIWVIGEQARRQGVITGHGKGTRKKKTATLN